MLTPESLEALYKSTEDRARKDPNRLKRIHAGMYLVCLDGKLYMISNPDETKYWICVEYPGSANCAYSDPYDTLWELKQVMGIK